MRYPESIQNKPCVGVTATSDGNHKEVDFHRLDCAKETLRKMGYETIETANVRTSQNGRSSSGEERARQLTNLLLEERVGAIFAAKGGDYLMEMLPYLDWKLIRNHPKWLQGFSDTTGLVFLATIRCDIATIYGNHFNEFGMCPWHESVRLNWELLKRHNVLQSSFPMYQKGFVERTTGEEGYELDYPTNCHSLRGETEVKLHGRLLGGCLDVLLNLVGTKYDCVHDFIERYREDGILWYLESFDLGAEALARGLWQLREAGWFEHATGFVFGRPAFYPEEGIPYDTIVKEQLNQMSLPILMEADVGHQAPQMAMINGAIATLDFSEGMYELTYEYQ